MDSGPRGGALPGAGGSDDARLDRGEKRIAFSLGGFSSLRENLVELGILSVFMNILGLALPLALLQVYDRIVPNAALDTLALLIIGVLTAVVLEVLIRVGRAITTNWIGAQFEHRASVGAYEKLLGADLVDYEGAGSGVHVERMSSIRVLREYYGGQAVQVLFDLPFVLLFVIMVGVIGGQLAIVVSILLVAFCAAALLGGAQLHNAIRGHMLSNERRLNFTIEVLSGIHTVKALAMENLMLRRYERLQETCSYSDHDVVLFTNANLALGQLFSQLTMVAVVSYGAVLVMDAELTVGGLAACTLLAGRALQPLQRAVQLWTRFQAMRLARERLDKVFDIGDEAPDGLPQLEDATGAIALQDVSLRFKPDQPPVLENLNLDVKAGECIGISGDNSSGKSSLLLMMAGVIPATTGVVRLDGHDISQYEPRSVRRFISYLPQDGEVFQGTLMENITMFRPDMEDRAMEAAELLGLDEVVAGLPHGYETMVGSGATQALPRGITQRLAIARALVNPFRLVLFDEANGGVDGSGDLHIRRTIETLKGRRTIILVTPRPSLLKLADRVFRLENRTLVPQAPQPQMAPSSKAAAVQPNMDQGLA